MINIQCHREKSLLKSQQMFSYSFSSLSLTEHVGSLLFSPQPDSHHLILFLQPTYLLFSHVLCVQARGIQKYMLYSLVSKSFMKCMFSTVYRVTQKDFYASPYTSMWAPGVARQISKRYSSSCHVFISMWGVISSMTSLSLLCRKSRMRGNGMRRAFASV